MAYAYVVSQMAFRTLEDAGDYQDYIYEETGYDAELRRTEGGFNIITVVEAKDRDEAIGLVTSLKEYQWEERSPQVIAVTKGGKEVMPLPADIPVTAFKESEARKRYEESEKAKKYRREFRKTPAFRKSQQKYQQSVLGQVAQRKYSQSEKGKEARKAYRQSEKGIAARKAYQERLKQRLERARELQEQQ